MTNKQNKPKILLWDIESSYNQVLTFGLIKQFIPIDNITTERHLYSVAYKWYGESKIHTISILDDPKRFKKDIHDDYYVVSEFRKVIEQADAEVAHYGCPTPDQKVLKSDLNWVRADSLKVGDKLLGFSAESKQGKGGRRKYEESVVTHTGISKQPVVEIVFNDRKIKCSKEHPLLVSRNKTVRNNIKWIKAGELKIGDRVMRVLDTWEKDNTYGGGYLSASFDGEGSWSQNNGDKLYANRLSFAQKDNGMLQKVIEELTIRDFNFSIYNNTSDGDVKRIQLIGGKQEIIKLMGILQPPRLLLKVMDVNKLGAVQTKEWEVVKEINDLGMQDIVELSTTTETYIMEGFASHNSQFDMKMFNARLVFHGLAPLPKIKSFDTKKLASRYFRFNSNKLDYLAQHLCGIKKLDNPKGLWIDCFNGDIKAIKQMVKYNKQDIVILEGVFNKLIPFMKDYSLNMNMFMKGARCANPTCGSTDIEWRGWNYTRTGKFRRFQCRACGSWGDERTAVKDDNNVLIK